MAAVVTYLNPTVLAGGTVAPTILQALGTNLVAAQMVLADADTTATITHNFQIPTAYSLFAPVVEQVSVGAGTAGGTLIVALTNSVSVTFTKSTAAGSARTILVYLARPYSLDL